MKLYTTERLSPRKERTPEGFLVCYDVPIARMGYQKYLPQENMLRFAAWCETQRAGGWA